MCLVSRGDKKETAETLVGAFLITLNSTEHGLHRLEFATMY